MKLSTDLHFIRRDILKELALRKWARFSDMRPKRVESNLYNYHLKGLIKDGYVENVKGKGYRLSPAGLRYADHVSFETFWPRWQPKSTTCLVTENNGKVLLWKKHKQPFIDKWSLPSGKIHFEDASIEEAMRREISYFIDPSNVDLERAGVLEYTAYIGEDVVTHTIAQVFKSVIDSKVVTSERVEWLDIADLKATDMAPGTKEMIEAVRKHKDIFMESLEIKW